MKLNKEEMLIASILTMLATNWLTWIITVPLCAFLWALTGSESKWNSKLWRRLAIPVIWSLSFFDLRMLLLVPVAYGFLTLGYGLPSYMDKGSFLGSFFWKLTKGNEILSNILTRGIIYGGAVLPYLYMKLT